MNCLLAPNLTSKVLKEYMWCCFADCIAEQTNLRSSSLAAGSICSAEMTEPVSWSKCVRPLLMSHRYVAELDLFSYTVHKARSYICD